MVALFQDKKIAIECDGEKWHSTEEQIKQDMERQSILERCSWEFIRIRGSKYFKNPESTMKDVIDELNKKGIYPEKMESENYLIKEEELLNKVKTKAFEILQSWNNSTEISIDTQIEVSKTKSINIPISEEIENEVIKEKLVKEDVQEINFKDATKEKIEVKNNHNINEKDIFKFLDDENIKYIDHRIFSGLLWVMYDEDKKEMIEKFFKKNNYNYFLEKRGTLLTSGKAAWRIKNL